MDAQGRRPARQRKHRLPREAYTGEIVVAFTACVARQISPFTDASLVDTFKCFLSRASHTHGCRVLGYCFMPDHVHVALQGTRPSSDLRKAMSLFKQLSGYWLARNRPEVRWQRGFYDHVLRREEDILVHLRYIAENPVRRGLVDDWRDYGFTGSDVFDLRDMLAS